MATIQKLRTSILEGYSVDIVLCFVSFGPAGIVEPPAGGNGPDIQPSLEDLPSDRSPFSWAIQPPCRPTSRAQGDGTEAVSLPAVSLWSGSRQGRESGSCAP